MDLSLTPTLLLYFYLNYKFSYNLQHPIVCIVDFLRYKCIQWRYIGVLHVSFAHIDIVFSLIYLIQQLNKL